MIGLNRRRVQSLYPTEFARECHKLHAEMLEKHWTSQHELPPYYLSRYLLLHEEYLRRGTQLRLFNDYD